jgi:membrane-associated phospholipid phosphatase
MRSTFEGMEGMVGNSTISDASSTSGSNGLFFPDRVSLPFVTTEYPPGSPISDNERIDIPWFPLRNWATDWYSWLVLTQFVTITEWDSFDILPSWAATGDWNSRTAVTGQQLSAYDVVQSELDCLVVAAQDERADALGEILAQKDEFISYFLDLLTTSNGYPATARVLAIANFVAGYCAMYYKGKYRRPRPSMLCPALMPPIPVPGHASFPSGHSTQTHLIALCMADVLINRNDMSPMNNNVSALADRITRNREIAGLHYPSDSDAGKDLASQIHRLLGQPLPRLARGKPNPAKTWYQLALDDARSEWEWN